MDKIKLTKEEIKNFIPHRDPMLLIDEVTALFPGESITANFYVDGAQEIFKGHFPEDPVFPGVYTTESFGQAAGVMLLSLERYRGKTPLLIGVNNAKFIKKIRPGATIEIRVKLLSEKLDKAIATSYGEVYVNSELACSGEVTLAFR